MLTHDEMKTIHAIAARAVGLYQRLGFLKEKDVRFARNGIAHEVMTVHDEILRLRLQELLDADDFNFAHDIGGIHKYLDDGKLPRLRNCFIPRFAAV